MQVGGPHVQNHVILIAKSTKSEAATTVLTLYRTPHGLNPQECLPVCVENLVDDI